MLLPIAMAALVLVGGLNADPTPPPKEDRAQFQTHITLSLAQATPYEREPLPPLVTENVLDGGTRIINCYPSLPPQTTYTFWNADHYLDDSVTLHPYIHAYNREFFQPGERVQITIYRPDHSIYLRQTVTAPVNPLEPDCEIESAAVGLSWSFLPDDPAGEWQVEFWGEDEREITYTTQLEPHPEAWISQACLDSRYTFFLDGFEPSESLHLLMVDAAEAQPNYPAEIDVQMAQHWRIEVDKQGQLRLEFDADVQPGTSSYLLVERGNGEIIGLPQPLQAESSLNRFHTCEGLPADLPITIEATTLPETSTRAECPDAPPSRFEIGETVVVDFKELGALKIRTEPDYVNGRPLEQAYDADELLLLEGPVCDPAGDRWAWRVRLLRTGTEGWAAEGVLDDNWMCPLSDPECGS